MTTVISEAQSRYKTKGQKLDNQITPEQVPSIVQSLRNAFETEKTLEYKWRLGQLKQLRKLLTEGEKELCDALYADLRKSSFEGFVTEIATTLGEVDYAIDNLSSWMKPEAKGNTPLTVPSWSSVQRDPLGVVLIMGAWNYPVYLSLNPIIGAIAAGNCVLLKPGSYAANTSKALSDLLERYMDPECVKVVEGNRDVTSALLDQKFDKIFFTGSGFVGKIVAKAAAEHLTPVVLELGGKSPCIVDKSAGKYLDFACRRIAWGCFTNCGQTCVRPDFVLVHNDIKQQFFDKFKQVLREFYTDNPKKTEWLARCINDGAFKRLEGLVREHKGKIVAGGDTDASEKYIAPTVFDFGSDLKAFGDAAVMQDEIFGPLVPVCGYSDINQVVQFVRSLKTGKPLALYAFGMDSKFLKAIKTRTSAGGMSINDALLHLGNHELPFGGVGNSGMGSYHGKYSFDCFSHEKAILEKTPLIEDLPGVRDLFGMRFPPYSAEKQKQMRQIFHPALGKIMHSMQSPAISNLFKLLLIYVVLKVFGYKITK